MGHNSSVSAERANGGLPTATGGALTPFLNQSVHRQVRAHGISIHDVFGSGASSTVLFHAVDDSGAACVVKVLFHRTDAVDGHDPETFRRKPRQIQLLETIAPAAARCFVPIRQEVEGPGWTAHVLPYVEGEDLLATLRSGGADAVERSAADWTTLLSVLTEAGYCITQEVPVERVFEKTHVRRLCRRLTRLDGVVNEKALTGGGAVVNGAWHPSAREIVERMRASSVLKRCQPGPLSAPVHGDLNTRNVIVTSKSEFCSLTHAEPSRPSTWCMTWRS